MTLFAQLHITEAGRPDRTIAVTNTLTIGRDNENDIMLESITVSRCHALLLPDAAGLRLLDLESTNGTLVNGVLAPTDEQARYAASPKRSTREPLERLADQMQHLRLSAAETRCALPKGS